MLQKESRINRARQYNYIYKNGRRVIGKYLILFVSGAPLLESRAGVVTSKRIGNAVIRNRAKRQLREVIRKSWNGLPKGYDFVVVARYGINEATFEQLEREFLRLIRKAVNK